VDPLADISLTHRVDGESATFSVFLSRSIERGAGRVRLDDWRTTRTAGVDLGTPIMRTAAEGREYILLERGETLVHVSLFGSHVSAAIADRDERRVHETLDWLRELFPSPEPTVRHEVPVTFWTYGPHGPLPVWRSIAVPGWADIHENYGERTRRGLERLMTDFTPERGGQLVLWHGRAGTGKTYALRALAWEWREWCEFHYIVDPDTFFGQHADYLMNVLLQPTEVAVATSQLAAMGWTGSAGVAHGMVVRDYAEADDEGEEEDGYERGWKLLMLEDTGELLTSDARAVIGQGLSRFLNVVDGLIGQGLRVLVLVTTNEEIRTLHPAVARPGRCAANVEFQPLTSDEAAAWLRARDVDAAVDGDVTLAALYAVAEGLDPEAATVEPAFAPD
jgi:Domain of unknown function (DUF5925)/ATPase family associated with various cellular activities (AAA)